MIRQVIGIFLMVALASACSTAVQLEGEWKDIPIVYALLSKQDTAHYIRIEKAFLPAGGDATEAAQNPDSLYYPSLVVNLEKVSTGQRFPLVRVDGTLEGYPREAGAFAQAPNYLYKLKADAIRLQGGERLRLWIDRPGNSTPVSAETVILQDLIPRETSPSNPINMGYDRQVGISWTAPAAAQVFEVRLRMHYRESAPGQVTVFTNKVLDWVLVKDLLRTDNTDRVNFSFYGESFYRFLAQELPENPGVRRIFDRMDILISAGGQEFADMLRIARANTGITSSQWTPYYSNISEGRGVFSSRSAAIRQGLQLSAPAMDSLRQGIWTRKLNFQ